MRWLRRGWNRLIGTLTGSRREADLAEELESHIRMQAEDNMRLGMSVVQARRAAVVKFGGLESAKESIRDQRGLPGLECFLKDLRFAARGIRKNTGFAAAVILTLALGIGANTAIFSVVYAVLLKPLPYSNPEQIYAAEIVIPERASQFASLPVTVQVYLEWRKAQTVFASMAALTPWECSLTGDGEPERLGGARVSANFFSFLGFPIAHGRGFAAEEEQPGREKVVVISDELWRRRYAADPSLIGKSIDINGERHTVVGIAAPSLLVPTGTQLHALLPFAPRVDLWKPIAPTDRELQGESWDHGLLVRLKPGESLEHGREQLRSILKEFLHAQAPELRTEFLPQLVPIRDVYAGKVRLRLLLILGASAILLLTACINIANLFLARVASRASEFAMRIALGAGRARILSQALTESMLLALLGGALGAVIAKYGAGLLSTLGPDDVRLLADRGWNLPLFLFAFTVSLATGVACGIFPAWQAYRKDAAKELQEGARATLGGRSTRFRQLLVVIEMALGTVLLASSALLLHSFVKVMRTDRGYEIERVLALDLSLFGERYRDGADRIAFYRELAANVRALPGVLAAGSISDLPAVAGSSGASRTIFYATDSDFKAVVMQRPVAMIRSVTEGYFAASGSVLLAGRFLSDQEPTLAGVVSESLAKILWPQESAAQAVGHALRQGDVSGPLISIVGVVADVRPGALERDLPPFLYRPHGQWASGPMTVVVRTAQEPAALAAAVRGEIRKIDPNLPVASIRTMEEIISASVAQRRFQMTLTSLFAIVALLLGAVGIYGVVSYSVACRTREVGLRIALGATSRTVLRWILSQGMRPVFIGLVLGFCGAVAIAEALRSLLFGIAPADPISLGGVVLILLFTSAVACYLPARRAAKLDPLTALRHE